MNLKVKYGKLKLKESIYNNKIFSAPVERTIRFSDFIVKNAPPVSTRVLDIGCGTGDQLFSLAERFVDGDYIGVDISKPNIAQANKNITNSNGAKRYTFCLEDYMEFNSEETFDLIISYSTLHLIPSNINDLFSHLATDLKKGGRLIFTIPNDSYYNHVLIIIRKIFKLFKGNLTDRMIFMLGKIIERNKIDNEQLKERINYMYMIPNCLDSPELRIIAKNNKLKLIIQCPEPHASLAQLKHNCVVMEKI